VTEYMIAVLPGDGIGPEVVTVANRVLLKAATLEGGLIVHLDEHDAGAERWLLTGEAMSERTFEACKGADAILMGAIGLPEARHPDGREVNGDVIFRLRYALDLYAGVRPVKAFAGLAPVLTHGKPIDYVIVRENTEGLYASSSGGTNVRGEVATDTLVITAAGTRRITEAACRIASRRPGRPLDGRHTVTCVDKANVLTSYAFFRSVFDEVCSDRPDIETDRVYVDAMAARQVLNPDQLDVVVAENMFGDIISDLAAATVGGLGLAASGDIGDSHALFQPAHGSAPDIAGRGLANPLAAVLSAAMMMDWLGERNADQHALEASVLIQAAVAELLTATEIRTPDLGGTASTSAVGDRLVAIIDELSRAS
jgi:3-isopropylmalate dehydrogenase